ERGTLHWNPRRCERPGDTATAVELGGRLERVRARSDRHVGCAQLAGPGDVRNAPVRESVHRDAPWPAERVEPHRSCGWHVDGHLLEGLHDVVHARGAGVWRA